MWKGVNKVGSTMFSNLTFNSVFVLFLGLLLIAAGVYVVISWRTYSFAAGLILLGLGSFLWGWTDGFSDYSPKGLFFWKIGVISLLIGFLLTGHYVYKFI